MPGSSRLVWIENTFTLVVLALGLAGCSASPSAGGTAAPAAAAPVAVAAPVPAPAAAPVEPPVVYPVMLGIDVLES